MEVAGLRGVQAMVYRGHEEGTEKGGWRGGREAVCKRREGKWCGGEELWRGRGSGRWENKERRRWREGE